MPLFATPITFDREILRTIDYLKINWSGCGLKANLSLTDFASNA
jgi:hypothetical protein